MNEELENASEEVSNVQSASVLQVKKIRKTFHQGGRSLTVLNDLQLRLEPGEIVALVGPSGSGKSTLLQLAGLLDTPTAGHIVINGQDTRNLKDVERTALRRRFIGFVYQFHHLLPEFSALENVMLPRIIAGAKKKEAKEDAERLLVPLGLQDRLDHRPARLSGGEQQRVAIARALVNKPKLILADEPTGNLDLETAEEVFDILMKLVHEEGISALVATHNLDLADQMDRVLELRNGRVLAF